MLCVEQKLSTNASEKYFRAFHICIIHRASASSILHNFQLAKTKSRDKLSSQMSHINDSPHPATA